MPASIGNGFPKGKRIIPVKDKEDEKMIQAIMFAEGEKAEKNPEPAVYAVRHGMIVENHSYSHQHFSELSCQKESVKLTAAKPC